MDLELKCGLESGKIYETENFETIEVGGKLYDIKGALFSIVRSVFDLFCFLSLFICFGFRERLFMVCFGFICWVWVLGSNFWGCQVYFVLEF